MPNSDNLHNLVTVSFLQYHLLNPTSSKPICNITPVIKNEKFIPKGLVFSLFTLLTDKLNIILPTINVIKPTITDSINNFNININ